jgi:hypothetical protein
VFYLRLTRRVVAHYPSLVTPLNHEFSPCPGGASVMHLLSLHTHEAMVSTWFGVCMTIGGVY